MSVHLSSTCDNCLQKNCNPSLNLPEGKITTGYGEYIVFYPPSHGERKEVSQETYERVYSIFNDYSPSTIVNRNLQATRDVCDKRFDLIRSKVKEIDSALEVAFVPSTLYELIFIRKCIREDLKHKDICPLLKPLFHEVTVESWNCKQEELEQIQQTIDNIKRKKCWHLCYFEDAGDNEHSKVKEIAYRLNKAITKALCPKTEGFTREELLKYTEKEIKFLRTYHQSCSEEDKKRSQGEKTASVFSCSYPGPTTNFGYESNISKKMQPMGIRNDNDAQIIRNAVEIECSAVAQRAFILYRGADYDNDNPFKNDTPYSLSFGTGLFGGSLFDGSATAFYYMRREKNAFAYVVPFDQLHRSPFYIPSSNTLVQLYGNGEAFHARTKGWKGSDLERISGIKGPVSYNKTDQLKTELSKEELLTQFQMYKSKAIQLK